VTAFLVDEMFPAAAAELLRTKYGRDAVHVSEVGPRAADDTQVAAAARAWPATPMELLGAVNLVDRRSKTSSDALGKGPGAGWPDLSPTAAPA
jgi:Domain of unknown function (DUF5615)